MAEGLMDRYEAHGADPPDVMYVDKNCCRSSDDHTAIRVLFSRWDKVIYRLDPFHFMMRLGSAANPTHGQYKSFLRDLSKAIFIFDGPEFTRTAQAYGKGEYNFVYDCLFWASITCQFNARQ